MGWAWDFRSVARSSKPMEDGCGRARTLHKVRSFNLRYLLGQGDRSMSGAKRTSKKGVQGLRWSSRSAQFGESFCSIDDQVYSSLQLPLQVGNIHLVGDAIGVANAFHITLLRQVLQTPQ